MSASIQDVIQLTPSIRKKASANIWQRKDEAFNMPLLHERIQEALSETTGEEEDVFVRLRQIDLTEILTESPGLNKYFTCTFFVRRFAWISRNESGEYRYFSKIKDGYGYYALDLFDLLGVLMNLSSKKTIEYLKQTYKVKNVSKWDKSERGKYEENLQAILSLSQTEYPSLKRLLQSGLTVLTSFLEYGREKVNGKHLSDGNHAVFFLSAQHFKENFFPQKSISTLNQWVNLFAVLGLVEKPLNIPAELQVEAEKQQALKKRYNHVSFYSVPNYRDVLGQAETRAAVLLKNRISYHQLTKKLVFELFGKELYDRVYIQKTHGRKRKIDEKQKGHDEERIYTFFHVALQEKGVVVKNDLQEGSSLSKQSFNRLWKELTADASYEVSQPTSEERKKWGIAHQQIVARRISYENAEQLQIAKRKMTLPEMRHITISSA